MYTALAPPSTCQYLDPGWARWAVLEFCKSTFKVFSLTSFNGSHVCRMKIWLHSGDVTSLPTWISIYNWIQIRKRPQPSLGLFGNPTGPSKISSEEGWIKSCPRQCLIIKHSLMLGVIPFLIGACDRIPMIWVWSWWTSAEVIETNHIALKGCVVSMLSVKWENQPKDQVFGPFFLMIPRSERFSFFPSWIGKNCLIWKIM